MSTRTRIVLFSSAVIVLGGFLTVQFMLRRGFSAKEQPSATEAYIARWMRHHAVPRDGREMKNPVASTPEVLSEARGHFADHCASCHGNDGRGQTQIGQSMYPKAPDMASATTQALSDGEIFYIIKNGVRLTGMPAWGGDSPEDDHDSWKLVHFIRHLPGITPDEIEEMESLNPKSREEFEQEQEIREFLEGEEASSPPQHKH